MHLQIPSRVGKRHLDIADPVLLINRIVQLIPILQDRIDVMPIRIPPALLAVGVAAEKFQDLVLFEIAAVEPQHPLYVRYYQGFINRFKFRPVAQQVPCLINGDVPDLPPLILSIVRTEHKAEPGVVNGIFNRVGKSGDLLRHAGRGKQRARRQ